MQLVVHRCPDCQASALAPVVAIEPGNAGLWQCESCNTAFEIQIGFRAVAPRLLAQRRSELRIANTGSGEVDVESEAASADRCEELRRQLVDNERESERLGQLVDELRQEADRLRKEMEEE